MAELIYSKYSNERGRRFAIRTDILEEAGERYVEKNAFYKEGKAHVDNLLRWYKELTKLYEEIPFACNKCEKSGEGVRLEYVEGQTLEALLDSLLEQGRVDEAEKKLTAYLMQVKFIYDKEPFTVTEEFRRVFGNGKVPEGLTCAPVTNIDMVCANLVLTEVPTVLDYEWTFDFPVPCQYVLYRIIHYYLDTHTVRKALDASAFYRDFAVTEEQREFFGTMEANFQRYLTGTHIPAREMFASMTPGVANVEAVSGGRLQIFFSFGAGYREEQSQCFPMTEGAAACTVKLPAGCVRIRIDPGDQACAALFEKVSFDGAEAELEEAIIDGGFLSGRWVYIAQSDPNISEIPVPKGAKELEISVKTYPAAPGLLLHIQAMDQEIVRLKAKVQKQSRLIQDMRNTKIWKLYQKYRDKVERKK
ncbi:MAG: hypothetical protein Q4D16_04065 [Eubacteriales bacterium]|nr:hypothetical protein [Eubacteriales bacterium]